MERQRCDIENTRQEIQVSHLFGSVNFRINHDLFVCPKSELTFSSFLFV